MPSGSVDHAKVAMVDCCLSCAVTSFARHNVEGVSIPSGDEKVEYLQYRFVPPPGATDLLIIRHGESAPAREDQPADTRDGHSDPGLDPVGEQQARLTADRLAAEPLAAMYVTTLRRTAQTAAPVAARLGL